MSKVIFIVDDEKAISKLLKYWVKDKWDYETEVFDSGETLLKRLDSKKPDLLLLDIMLPGISGLEVLKKIRTKDEQLPVIMLSAQGNVETAVDSLRYGAYDYFPKPIDVQRLEPAVKNAIKNYELTKELENLKESVQKEYSFDNIISADLRLTWSIETR